MRCRLHGRALSRQALKTQAFTLIELLIVMGILTILATLSLTTVKGLLKDQKITQSAQLVREYLETARLRALTSGRPVAVFLERTSLLGDSTGAAVPANFTTTRLSIGEVFPPYTGDVIGATGAMYDINFDFRSGAPGQPRQSDNYADQIRFALGDVAAGFGPGGFISEGDTIEFEGYGGRFAIERIRTVGSQVAVTFFNPPTDYNNSRFAIIASGGSTDGTFEVTHAQTPPQIPVANAIMGVSDSTAPVPSLPAVAFRVYRRPTKSMVGAVTLPRGTCVDLAASGFGPDASGAGAPATVFGANMLPGIADTPANALKSGSYSRIGVMFSGDGRLSNVIAENSVGGIKLPAGAVGATQVLHLLVGKSEQVFVGTGVLQRSLPSDRDQVISNLLDPENVWISCNPFTGEVRSSQVANVDDATLATAITNSNVAVAVQASRAFSTAGVKSQ